MASANAIKQLEAKIKEDSKNINDLSKIVHALKSKDNSIALVAMLSMRRLMIFFAEKGDLKNATTKAKEPNAKKTKTTSNSDALTQYRKWLWGIYVSFIKEMLDWLLNKHECLQVEALRTLMELVSREGDFRSSYGKSSPVFGNETFARVIQQLVSLPEFKGEVESVFKGEFVGAYADVQYYTLKHLARILENKQTKLKSDESSEGENDDKENFSLVSNAIKILDMIQMPESSKEIKSFLVPPIESGHGDNEVEDELVSSDEESEDESENNMTESNHINPSNKRQVQNEKTNKTKKKGLQNVKQHEFVFSNCWMALLRHHQFPKEAYEKILEKLPEEIMPHLVNPLLLSDFLTDSYNIGGMTSVLALNSLFVLIQNCNFDYPDFYTKLYQLLDDPTLLSTTTKQRSRFFELVNLFLSSTHLPVYLIAAFAKRFSRLALTAEPGVILFIIPLVYNLILRHKECLQLIHRHSGTSNWNASEKAFERRKELSSFNQVDAAANKLKNEKDISILQGGHDPFKNEEKDPSKSNALKSSLWELYSMKHHYNAEVASKACMFEEKLRHQFLSLDDCMKITYKSLFEKQIKRKEKNTVPLAFKPVTTLFTKEDGFAKVFQL